MCLCVCAICAMPHTKAKLFSCALLAFKLLLLIYILFAHGKMNKQKDNIFYSLYFHRHLNLRELLEVTWFQLLLLLVRKLKPKKAEWQVHMGINEQRLGATALNSWTSVWQRKSFMPCSLRQQCLLWNFLLLPY